MPRLTCLVLTLSLVGYGGFSGSGWGDSTAGWEEDGGSPATFGDDDDASNDDDATDDDDDATDDDTTPPPGDDDDDTPAPGAPAITSVTSNWNGSTGEFEFTIYMSDGDCDLGLPTIYWSVDGVEQSPATLTGGSLSCSGQVDFFIGGLTATYSYTFGFWIDDSAGNLSAPYTLTVTAA